MSEEQEQIHIDNLPDYLRGNKKLPTDHSPGFYEGYLKGLAANRIESLQVQVKSLESQLSEVALKSLSDMRGVVDSQEASTAS